MTTRSTRVFTILMLVILLTTSIFRPTTASAQGNVKILVTPANPAAGQTTTVMVVIPEAIAGDALCFVRIASGSFSSFPSSVVQSVATGFMFLVTPSAGGSNQIVFQLCAGGAPKGSEITITITAAAPTAAPTNTPNPAGIYIVPPQGTPTAPSSPVQPGGTWKSVCIDRSWFLCTTTIHVFVANQTVSQNVHPNLGGTKDIRVLISNTEYFVSPETYEWLKAHPKIMVSEQNVAGAMIAKKVLDQSLLYLLDASVEFAVAWSDFLAITAGMLAGNTVQNVSQGRDLYLKVKNPQGEIEYWRVNQAGARTLVSAQEAALSLVTTTDAQAAQRAAENAVPTQMLKKAVVLHNGYNWLRYYNAMMALGYFTVGSMDCSAIGWDSPEIAILVGFSTSQQEAIAKVSCANAVRATNKKMIVIFVATTGYDDNVITTLSPGILIAKSYDWESFLP